MRQTKGLLLYHLLSWKAETHESAIRANKNPKVDSSCRFEKTRGATLAIRSDKPLAQIDGTPLSYLLQGHRDSIFHGNNLMRQ